MHTFRFSLVTLLILFLMQMLPVSTNRQESQMIASAAIVKPQGLNRELEKQIVDKILGEGYDKRIRPSGINNKTGQNDGPAVVRVNTLIRSISKIDDVTMEYSVQLSLRQEWVDERLAFNKMASYKNYNINSITLTEQERLWKPDLFFRNEKEGHFHKIIMPNVLLRINGDGAVLYSIRISLVLACPMDLKYYPLDKQNCTIEMASYGYLDDDLKFIWKEKNPVQINQPLTLPRFTLETFGTAFCTSRTATGAYSCLRVDLIFKREFSYYLIQIYIPCCMLVIVSWVSFWLDPNAIPARVSLGVTTLLTMATQISGINASLPPVSYTKAIDVWTGVCLTFVFGALLEFALVNYASRSDAHARVQQARQEEQLRQRELEFQQRRQLALAAAAYQQQQQQQQQHQQQLQHTHKNGARGGAHYAQKFAQQQNSDQQQQPNNASKNGGGVSPARNQLQHQYTIALGAEIPYSGMGLTAGHQSSDKQALLANGNGTMTLPSSKSALAKQHQQQQSCDLHHSTTTTTNQNVWPSNAALQRADGSTLAAHHHSTATPTTTTSGGQNAPVIAKKRNVNFCRAWLNKFPSRSKRIDVISRIFFPKMFALFNLVYWTTYLFREDDIVRS